MGLDNVLTAIKAATRNPATAPVAVGMRSVVASHLIVALRKAAAALANAPPMRAPAKSAVCPNAFPSTEPTKAPAPPARTSSANTASDVTMQSLYHKVNRVAKPGPCGTLRKKREGGISVTVRRGIRTRRPTHVEWPRPRPCGWPIERGSQTPGWTSGRATRSSTRKLQCRRSRRRTPAFRSRR